MKSHILWDYAGRFSSAVIQFIISAILARLLSPADYGLVGIAMAISGIASIFVNFGFGSYIVQADKLDNKVLSSILWFNIGVGLLVYVLILISIPTITSFYYVQGLDAVLKWLSITIVLNIINSVPSALLTKSMRFKELNVRNITMTLISGVFGVVLAYSNFGVWALVWQSLFVAVVGLIVNFIIAGWRPDYYFSFRDMKGCFRFGIFMFLSGALEGIYSRVDVFLIGKVFSPTMLGYYSRAQSLETMIRGLSSNSILTVLLPAFSKIKNDLEATQKLYYKYLELICFIFSFIAASLYLAAPTIFIYIFGEKWINSIPFFQILVLMGWMYPMSALMLLIIEARGNSKSFFWVELLKKILLVPAYVIAYYYDILLYLKVLFSLYFVAFAMNLFFLNSEISVGYKNSVQIISKYAITSIVVSSILFEIIPSKYSITAFCISWPVLAMVYFFTHYYLRSRPFETVYNTIKKNLDKVIS